MRYGEYILAPCHCQAAPLHKSKAHAIPTKPHPPILRPRQAHSMPQRSYWIPGASRTNNAMSAASHALPPLRTWGTPAKNPRDRGHFSWAMPRCGRCHLRNSDQKPSSVCPCTAPRPSPSALRAHAPRPWLTRLWPSPQLHRRAYRLYASVYTRVPIQALGTVMLGRALPVGFRVLNAALADVCGLTRGVEDTIWPASFADRLITLTIIDEKLEVDLHGWTPVSDRRMGGPPCAPSSHATPPESNKSVIL